MRIGDLLVAHGLVTREEIDEAMETQGNEGGRLGDILEGKGQVSRDAIESVLEQVPKVPKTIEDTGLTETALLRLLVKSMAIDGFETPTQFVNRLKLPFSVVNELLRRATDKKLMEALGATDIRATELRYGLTNIGRDWAQAALFQNQYVGAAPIPLARFCQQVRLQRIVNERFDRQTIQNAFDGLVMPDGLIRKIGPAVNAMRAVLMYGPPGNGKTTIAEKVGRIFKHFVFVPHALDVDGQIIKVFDPSVHAPVTTEGSVQIAQTTSLVRAREGDYDQRFVPCRRPIVIVGGELTLDMLDLQFNQVARFYEAPLHVKALNGTFIIDDFGRQLVRPQELLNRWIVPLESRVDYLKLHTGNSFSVPFDEFVVFSTNLTPEDLVDPAFLRRIPYKLEIGNPSPADYRKVFQLVADGKGLYLDDEVFEAIRTELAAKSQPLAFYHAKFITDQVLAACKYEGRKPALTRDLVLEALDNLFMHQHEPDPLVRTAARV
ncbi:MAG: hypothetical protein GVY13_16735 [Alphaproteobacteria bacterium]|jgi:hypothetical protein|nr:hypothetical protein [Alphaproteobacteria bacterium]